MERVLRDTLAGTGFEKVGRVRSRMMQSVRGRGNRTTELRLRYAMVRAGIKGWQLQVRDLPGSPDFFFAHSRLAVFVDGCFWHGCPRCYRAPSTRSAFWRMKVKRNRSRDAATTADLYQQGIRVLRLWECDLAGRLDQAIARVKKGLRREKRHRGAALNSPGTF